MFHRLVGDAPVAVAGGGVWCGVRDHSEKERAGEIFVHLLVPRAGTPKGESPIATAGGAASGPSSSGAAARSPTRATPCAQKSGDYAKANSPPQGQTETQKDHAEENVHSQESDQEDRA